MQFSKLTDYELEMVLRKKFKDQPQDVPLKAVSYKAVDKDIHGPKINSAKTIRRDIVEFEAEQYFRPAVGSYDLRKEEPLKTVSGYIGVETREKKEEFDMRRGIYPNYDTIKKKAPEFSVAPQH